MKASFNAATDGLAGLQQLAGDATLLYYTTDEAKEGRDAFKEKRPRLHPVPEVPEAPCRSRRGFLCPVQLIAPKRVPRAAHDRYLRKHRAVAP